ncbi:MAG: NUDIX domain-containing protein [Puniceicoccales bacterium]|nr:NUDIX domain-containing protein [Puniceicoccales bacterium]
MSRHFSARAYVYDPKRQRILLLKHRQLDIWVEPGGHVDANERPDDAAVREVLEETGIIVRLVSAPAPNFPAGVEKMLVQPLGIRAMSVGPQHEHVEFIYASVAVDGSLKNGEREFDQVRWFTLEEIRSAHAQIPRNVCLWSLICAEHVTSKILAEEMEGMRYDGK